MRNLSIDEITTIAELRKPLEGLGFQYKSSHNVLVPSYILALGEDILKVRHTSKLGACILEYKRPKKLVKYDCDSIDQLLKKIDDILTRNTDE